VAYKKWVVQRTGRYTYQRVLRRFHLTSGSQYAPKRAPLRIADRYADGRKRG
jgi:hypothetical protein